MLLTHGTTHRQSWQCFQYNNSKSTKTYSSSPWYDTAGVTSMEQGLPSQYSLQYSISWELLKTCSDSCYRMDFQVLRTGLVGFLQGDVCKDRCVIANIRLASVQYTDCIQYTCQPSLPGLSLCYGMTCGWEFSTLVFQSSFLIKQMCTTLSLLDIVHTVHANLDNKIDTKEHTTGQDWEHVHILRRHGLYRFSIFLRKRIISGVCVCYRKLSSIFGDVSQILHITYR